MATTKKPATKKTAAKPTAKKPVVAKVKKPAVAKKVAAPKKAATKPADTAQSNFMTFTPTIQTFYWVIIGVMCISFTLWITKLQSDINAIYDSIDATNTSLMETTPTPSTDGDK